MFYTCSVCACSIDYSIDLQTFGDNVNVELRSGTLGNSIPIQSHKSSGGFVNFRNLCSGSYFLAIGNDDYVSVTPVRYFQDDASYSSRIVMQKSSGNVSKRSRKNL